MLGHDQFIPEERENQHLIEDLNHYYGTQDQDSASLARIRARLLQNAATSLPVVYEAGITHLPPSSRMDHSTRAVRPLLRGRLRNPGLASLAAALFLLVLVSSFALVLYLRQATATAPAIPSARPGWTLVATFQGTGNKTITGQHIEVGHHLGFLLTCANAPGDWAEVALLPEQSGGGSRCSSLTAGQPGPEGTYSSPKPLPPIQTITIKTDASASWQLSIFKGETYPPLNIDAREWHALKGEVDGTGSGIVQLDVTLPQIWALEYECYGTDTIQVAVQPYASVDGSSATLVTDPCDGQSHLTVSDTSAGSGTFQAVHQLQITTGAANDWQIVLLGCANEKPHCGLAPAPGSTAQPATTASPTSQLTQVYQFGEQDSGKIITYDITTRFSITLDGQKYPRQNLQVNCQPTGVIGTITNIPSVMPPDYVVRYEANLEGTCIIKNGSFVLTVKIITV